MITQTQISNYFKTKYGINIDQPMISRMLHKKAPRPVTSPFAFVLAEEFPGKTANQWKQATPEDLKRAFEQLNIKEVA